MEITGEVLSYKEQQAEVDRLNTEAWSLRTSDHKTALSKSEEAESIAMLIGYLPGIARSKRNLGYYSYKQGAYDRALIISSEALILFRQLGDKHGEADALYNLAITHLQLGDYSLALEELLLCLSLREQLNDMYGITDVLNNIGHIYFKFDDTATAMEYYNRALSISKDTGNKPGEGYALMNIATLLIEENKYEQALEYCQQSVAARKAGGDQHGVFVSTFRVGYIYYRTGKYEEALKIFNEVSVAAGGIGEKNGVARSHEYIGKANLKMKRYEEAAQSFNISLQISIELGARELVCDIHQALSELYEETGDARKAMDHFKAYHQKKESLWKTDSERILNNARTVHKADSAQKEAEIHRLRNVELAEALKMINDSITYAQRIQKAILPGEKLLDAILPQSMIRFRPRNVVSGDFYWLSGNKDKYFFAVADCTGHGVPGAFMSLICSSILTQVTKEIDGAAPDLILMETDRRVCEALKQHDADTRTHDGMDIALCYVDRKAKKALFAAANRPLILMRKGEMLQWKGDKYPIGGTQQADKAFTCHAIDLEENDILYMFTDGYPDQFGGKNGKKFSSKQLLQQIHKAHTLSFTAQAAAFSSTFDQWKGTHEQVDDVTLTAFCPL